MTSDEAERVAQWVEAYGTQTPVKELFNDIAALIRRLRDERDEARNKALDEAAVVIEAMRDEQERTAFYQGAYVASQLKSRIRALKSQEPEKP